MRLFIAVTFDDIMKEDLFSIVERLRSSSKSGTFTLKENLHLTVNFIGETKRLEEVKQAMKVAVDKTRAGSFGLSINGFGKFKRNEGDIYWLGVEPEPTLWQLQKELVKELKEAGFYDLDDKDYKPHLTLGRRVRVKASFQLADFERDLVPLMRRITKISLMNSERKQGILTYTEIYHVELDKN